MSWAFEEEEVGRGLRLDRRTLGRLLGFARPYLGLFGLAFLAVCLLFVIELILPWIVQQVVDGPVTRLMGGDAITPADLAPYIGAFVALLVVQAGANYGHVVLTSIAGQRVVRDLRVTLFRHVLGMSADYFDRVQTGRLVTRISSDCENLSELFTTGAIATLADMIKVVGLIVAMVWIAPSLSVVVLAAIPFLALITLWFQHRARVAYRQVRGRISRQTGFFAEAMQGIRVTRLFAQEDKIQGQYDRMNLLTRQGWITTLAMFSLYFSLIDFGTYGAQAAILWKGGFDIAGGGLSYGTFVRFWLYFGMMLGPLRSLGEKYNVLQSAVASAERLFQVLDERSSIAVPAAPAEPHRGPASIRFEGVDFSYRAGTPVLQGLDFELPPGCRAAVVGPTGAGKTTLIQLLARFRDPDAGRVLVGGQDLRELDLQAHRRRIGIVLQDVFLFATDMLENVRLWDRDIPEARVLDALRSVQALDIVDKAGGLHAPVEERGMTLSQGERQLLAFARALVHEPDILVLDEATANIDTRTERRIQDAMHLLMEGRTTVVIAHRLSTVREADAILVLDQGRLVELGRHEELLARGGLYSRLIRSLES